MHLLSLTCHQIFIQTKFNEITLKYYLDIAHHFCYKKATNELYYFKIVLFLNPMSKLVLKNPFIRINLLERR